MAKTINDFGLQLYPPPMILCCSTQLDYKEVIRNTNKRGYITSVSYKGECRHCGTVHLLIATPKVPNEK